VLIAVCLCIPRLALDYFWDDYTFLSNAQRGSFMDLLPSPQAVFYRPLSRGAYFLLLFVLGPAGHLAGHLINLAAFCISTALLVSLTDKLAGRSTGMVAGILFAALAPLPSLVAWASGAQDLFAITFVLGALYLRHVGRPVEALLAMIAALLSKETALVVVPLLIYWDVLVERSSARVRSFALLYGIPILVWALAHPGIRGAFAGASAQTDPSGYVGSVGEDSLLYFLRYVLVLFNIPITGLATPWPMELTLPWLAAVILILMTSRALARSKREEASAPPLLGLGVMAVLLGVPALLFPSVLIRVWSPYLAALAGIASSMVIAALLWRSSTGLTTAVLVVYVTLGVWSRGVVVPGGAVLTEHTLVDASQAAKRVRGNFKRVEPALPHGAQLLVSVGATGTRGIAQTLHEGRALNLWYGDRSLTALTPEHRRSGSAREYLFRVTPELDVIELDIENHHVRSNRSEVDGEEIFRPLRTYARGVAASGEPDRALRTLHWVARMDRGQPRSGYEARLIAMVLLSAGKDRTADSVLAQAPALGRIDRLNLIGGIFSQPTDNPAFDSLAFRAFEVSPSDPPALRYLMLQFVATGRPEQAVATARRLQTLAPGDSESAEVIRHGGK